MFGRAPPDLPTEGNAANAVAGGFATAAAGVAGSGNGRPRSPVGSKTAEDGSAMQTESTDLGTGSTPHPYSQEFFSEYFRRYELLIEFSNLPNPGHCPRGVYVMPTHDMNAWYGVIFIQSGYYKGGVFKFRMTIPPAYPAQPPRVQFQTDMFHPLVSNAQGPERGFFAVEVRKRLEDRKLGTDPNLNDAAPSSEANGSPPSATARSTVQALNRISRVLAFIKQCFTESVLKQLKEEDCLNKDAYDMYCSDHQVFTQLAQQCGQLSTTESSLYEQEAEDNPFQFDQLTDADYEDLRKHVLQETDFVTGVTSRNMARNVLKNLRSMGTTGLSGLGKIFLD